MTNRRFKAKPGDMVAVSWEDAVGYGRIEADPSEAVLAQFETYGKLGIIDAEKIVILHEKYIPRPSPEGTPKKTCIEPTAIPIGCVTKIEVFRRRGG